MALPGRRSCNDPSHIDAASFGHTASNRGATRQARSLLRRAARNLSGRQQFLADFGTAYGAGSTTRIASDTFTRGVRGLDFTTAPFPGEPDAAVGAGADLVAADLVAAAFGVDDGDGAAVLAVHDPRVHAFEF